MDVRNASIFELESALISRELIKNQLTIALNQVNSEIDALKNIIAEKKGFQSNTEFYKNEVAHV